MPRPTRHRRASRPPEAPPRVDPTARTRYLLVEALRGAVGRSEGLLRYEARNVGDGCYRLNVVREVGGRLTRDISHYVAADADGVISYCHPPMAGAA